MIESSAIVPESGRRPIVRGLMRDVSKSMVMGQAARRDSVAGT
jgi:hypothetical protein